MHVTIAAEAMLTDHQVNRLRKRLMEGETQAAAAAAAGASERSVRNWKDGPLPSEKNCPERKWRTRRDPFADVWEDTVLPLLQRDKEGKLEGKTVLELLRAKQPEAFHEGQLRTLQRRIREWRAVAGPEKEVFFEQKHIAGREAAVDFTHGEELGVTIAGVLLAHLIFEFVLSFSGWTWVCLAFGETYEALVDGVQGALWELRGVPEVIRTDNLSAATHELRKTGGRALTTRFRGFLSHYDLRSTRIKPGESNENGVVEQRHRRTKKAVAQTLVVRGSRDFDTVEAYETFVRGVVEASHNSRLSADELAAERAALRPLPRSRVPTYTSSIVTVQRWSTIRVSKRAYSVPSRLIGHKVEARVHPNTVEVWFRGKLLEVMPRLRGEEDARIDYRHVIWSLVKKPGAFARYRFREELFPSLPFRRAYDALVKSHGERADIEYVRILHLAASTMESTVEEALTTLLEAKERLDYAAVKAIASPTRADVPSLAIPAPDLAAYDDLIGGAA